MIFGEIIYFLSKEGCFRLKKGSEISNKSDVTEISDKSDNSVLGFFLFFRISLKGIWPYSLFRKPACCIVVAH